MKQTTEPHGSPVAKGGSVVLCPPMALPWTVRMIPARAKRWVLPDEKLLRHGAARPRSSDWNAVDNCQVVKGESWCDPFDGILPGAHAGLVGPARPISLHGTLPNVVAVPQGAKVMGLAVPPRWRKPSGSQSDI